MKIYLSLLISKKNLSLKKCLISLNNLKIHNNINFKFVFIIDHKIKIVSNLIRKIIDKKNVFLFFQKKQIFHILGTSF